jgi:hypothetical protein
MEVDTYVLTERNKFLEFYREKSLRKHIVIISEILVVNGRQWQAECRLLPYVARVLSS